MIKSVKYKDRINLDEFKNLSNSLTISEYLDYNIEGLKEDFCFILEFQKEVSYFYYQPIKFETRGEQYYIPDFIIKFWDGSKLFVDFDLDKKTNKHIIDFFMENNIEHHFIEPKYFENDLLLNIKFLLSYKTPKLGFKVSDIMVVKRLFQIQQKYTIQEIIDMAILDKSKKAEILYVVWYMISNYHLTIDIRKPLSMDTIVHLN